VLVNFYIKIIFPAHHLTKYIVCGIPDDDIICKINVYKHTANYLINHKPESMIDFASSIVQNYYINCWADVYVFCQLHNE